jgi:hypothetical protein
MDFPAMDIPDLMCLVGNRLAQWETALIQRLLSIPEKYQDDPGRWANVNYAWELRKVERLLLENREFIADPERYPAEDLLAEINRKWPGGMVISIESIDDIAKLVALMQLLDAWHRPIFAAARSLGDGNPQMLKAHSDALELLDLEGRLNRDFANGSLVPRTNLKLQTRDVVEDRDLSKLVAEGLFSSFLEYTLYLPPDLMADHQDDLDSRGGRRKTLRLATIPVRSASALATDPPEIWRMGIAPMAEAGSDVSFVPSACGNFYGLRLHYPVGRIRSVIEKAMLEDVHILLMPEMTLREEDISFTANAIVDARAAFATAHNGRLPVFRYLLAGILSTPMAPDDEHQNYVMLFDSDGIAWNDVRQTKMSHWNLNQADLGMFGIPHFHPGAAFADPVIEHSAPADTVVIMELPDFGRILTFICADSNHDHPGDWLMRNAQLDWVHAPIMDKSICWQNSRSVGHNPPWIVRRAHRSAQISRTLVTATNSGALTHWVNGAIERLHSLPTPPAFIFPRFAECGIGLAIDGSKRQLPTQHLTAKWPDQDIVKIFDLDGSGWRNISDTGILPR